MLPLLPLFGYLIDTQCVMRGSIAKNATPLLPLCYPWKLFIILIKLFYIIICVGKNFEFTGWFLGF